MSDHPIRVAMIGCGANGRGHVRRLAELPQVQLVACVDIRPAALDEVRNLLSESEQSPTVYSYHKDMLEEAQPDAVVISTPHSLHFEQIKDSLLAGAHVLSEKPLCGSADNARHLLRLANDKGLLFGISYQRHGMGKYRRARELVSSGSLGELYFIQGFLSQPWLVNQIGKWRTDPEMSGGGQINDSGSHLLGILLWIGDLTPVEVFAYLHEYKKGVDVVASLNVKMSGGALGNISILGKSPRGSMWEELTFYGEKGALLFRDNVLLWTDEKGKPEALDTFPESISPDANFIGAILGQQELACPANWGVKVAELTEAIYLSARTNRPVAVGDGSNQ